MSLRTVITVDGLAASGKSSAAEMLAARLKFSHLNSGRAYRAVGLLCLQHHINMNDAAAVEGLVAAHSIALVLTPEGGTDVLVDGRSVVQELDTPAVSEATSLTSRYAGVRQALLAVQREAFPGRHLVAEGRDMGTIIFPDAPLKFFIDAPEAVRIDRRLRQKGRGLDGQADPGTRQKAIIQEILERDKRDAERTVAPTVPASDAIIIDNSAAPLTEVIDIMYSHALARGIRPIEHKQLNP